MLMVMPSVRGMLLDEAQAALMDAAAKVSVEPAFGSDVPLRLRVIAQKPEPGTELKPRAEITLTVSPEHDR